MTDLDPIEVLRQWDNEPEHATALASVESLVAAASACTEHGQIWSVNPADLRALRRALQPFITTPEEHGG